MPHFVYMVRCADRSLYTGYSTDPDARVAKHNAGNGAKYTRSHRPVELVLKLEAISASAAKAEERRLKKMSRSQKEEFLAAWSEMTLDQCYVFLLGGAIGTLLVPGVSFGQGWWWKSVLVALMVVALVMFSQWILERSLMRWIRSFLKNLV